MSVMKILIENWKKHLKDKKLKEVTEIELEDIQDILYDLDPEDVSFSNIFGDKMRIIVPMPIKDRDLELLKNTLEKSGYAADFSTGLASFYQMTLKDGDKYTRHMLSPEQVKNIPSITAKKEDESDEAHQARIKKFKKKQIKIGRLLQKGAKSFETARKSQDDLDKIKPADYPDEYDKYRESLKGLIDNADTDLERLQNTFPDFTSRVTSKINPFDYLSNFWHKKSDYYREHPEASSEGATGKYSIIYTRHPIDVLRMSDFDNIQSCHSPTSRGGGAEYYKCAVAEAYGHGFMAYVVEDAVLQNVKTYRRDSKKMSNQEMLDDMQDKEEELFKDAAREKGWIVPLSRVRVKKYTNPSLKLALAVPEERVYGQKFPSFVSSVVKWAKDKQENTIEKIELDDEGSLDLTTWERHGGTYQDTNDSRLLYNLLGATTYGKVHIDRTTEDNIDLNQHREQQWIQEVEDIELNYNRRMDHIEVSAEVVEGYDELYIDVTAGLIIKIDESDFKHSAFQEETRRTIEYIPDELEAYDIPVDDVSYTVDSGKVVITLNLQIDKINPDGTGTAFDPRNFEHICLELDLYDDKMAAIEYTVKHFLRLQRVLEGGELLHLVDTLENESWYEWDYDVDNESDPTDLDLSINTYVNLEDLIKKIPVKIQPPQEQGGEIHILHGDEPIAMAYSLHGGPEYTHQGYEVKSPEFRESTKGGFKGFDEIKEYVREEIASMILMAGTKTPKGTEASRNYHIKFRELIAKNAGAKEGEFNYPHSSLWVTAADDDKEYRMAYEINLSDSDPDKTVESAHSIIAESDDEDLLKKLFKQAFVSVAKIPAAIKERKRFKKMKILIERKKVITERVYGRGTRDTGKGGPVAAIQQTLVDKGYELPIHKVDGKYGPETAAAVKKFQEDEGVKVDGIVGPETLDKLGISEEELTQKEKEQTPLEATPVSLEGGVKITGGYGDAKVGEVQGERARFYPDMTKIGGSRSWRNNNPGNLRLVTAWKHYGAMGREQPGRKGFAIFPTEEAGFKALEEYIYTWGAKRNKTITEFTNMYAPAQDSNNPASYAARVAREIGVRVDTNIGDIVQKIPQMARAMSKVEVWTPGQIADAIIPA